MSILRLALLASFVVASFAGARAGTVVDRIKSENVIRCGGAPRPGLVGVSPDGRAEGLYLDLCRAIGAALLGPDGRVEFHQYDSDKAFDTARDGADEVLFLSASEIIDQDLAGKIAPGPPVFYESTAVMVTGASKVQHLWELAGQSICFLQGDNSHRNLEAWFAAHHLDFLRMAYQEPVELFDTFNVQVCKGLAGEATTLAAARLADGEKDMHARILPEPLAIFPVIAATGTQDAQWSSIVAWAIHTLVDADAPKVEWAAGGLDTLILKTPELGLADGWQKRVVDAGGSYATLFSKNLGENSRLKLAAGANASWRDGGLFVAPFSE